MLGTLVVSFIWRSCNTDSSQASSSMRLFMAGKLKVGPTTMIFDLLSLFVTIQNFEKFGKLKAEDAKHLSNKEVFIEGFTFYLPYTSLIGISLTIFILLNPAGKGGCFGNCMWRFCGEYLDDKIGKTLARGALVEAKKIFEDWRSYPGRWYNIGDIVYDVIVLFWTFFLIC